MTSFAFEQRLRRRVAHAVDRLVDLRVLLDIGVGARHIGFRLVVVVVADEILDGVVREEVLHLAIELGGQRLVGGEDERGLLHRLDHLRHGEGLARAGDPEQHLVALLAHDPGHEVADGGRLVAVRLIFGDHFEPAQRGLRRLLLWREEDGRGAGQDLGHGRDYVASRRRKPRVCSWGRPVRGAAPPFRPDDGACGRARPEAARERP